MSRDTKTLATLVGIIYLCVGLAALPAPVMFLLYVPKSDLASKPFLMNMGVLILLFGPSFLIAYAWIRLRKWGRYFLIAYNGLWFGYMSYGFVARMINYSESHLVLVIAGFLIPLIVLGGLIAFAFQEDVKAVMSR